MNKPEYAGFISYRRVASDQRWAKWLHRQLEAFRVPRDIVRSYSLESNKLGRFFLDDAETAAESNLSAKIRESLEEAESLVVVCSPQIKDAPWVGAEIEYFAATHSQHPVILLLIEGEPEDSFPQVLINNESGDGSSVLESTLPLAADVRQNKWWQFVRRRLAVTKIAAAILKKRIGLDFDQLWQRERKRITQRRRFLGVGITSLAGVVGGLSWWGFDERRKAANEKSRVRHVRAAEAFQEVSTLWSKDSQQALAILEDLERIPKELRDFTWDYFFRLCRSFEESVTIDASPVTSIAFLSQSTGRLLIAQESGRVTLWDADAGNLRTLAEVNQRCVCAAVSGSGQWIAATYESGGVQVWDSIDDFSSRMIETEDKITAVEFSDELLCIGSNKGIVTTWDAESLEMRTEIQVAAPVYQLRSDSHGRLIGTGEVGVVWMRTPEDNGATETIGELDELHQVNALALSSGSQGTFVTTGGGISAIIRPFENASHVVRIWGLGDGIFRKGLLDELSGHEDSITGLAASDSEYTVYSVSNDGSLRVWNLVSRKQVLNLTAERSFLTCVACSADANRVATGGSNGEVRIWNTSQRGPVRTTSGVGVTPLRSLAAANSKFATSDDIGRLRLWNVRTLREVAELAPHGDTRYGLCFSSDDKMLAAGTRRGDVQIWSVQERELTRTLSASWLGFINSTAFSPGGRLAACGTGGVAIWNMREWGLEASIRSFGEVHDVGFSDNLLVFVCSDGVVRTWDLRSNTLRRTISTGHESIDTLAIHPQATIAAIADAGNAIEIWNLATGKQKQILVGHRKAVRTITFSPDGKTLASGGFDDRVILWDDEVGVKRTEFNCPEGTVCSVRFAENGNTLLAAGGGEFGAIEHRIHAWDAM